MIYVDSADKAARFVMNCNQDWLPMLFLQDVNGFMVGRDCERAASSRPAPSWSTRSATAACRRSRSSSAARIGAGNYALCGKAFDPRFIFAWPTARYAVMGGEQAANTLLDMMIASFKKQGRADRRRRAGANSATQVAADYERQTDIRYAAARLWVDAILDPAETRSVLIQSLEVATRQASDEPFRVGVYQV